MAKFCAPRGFKWLPQAPQSQTSRLQALSGDRICACSLLLSRLVSLQGGIATSLLKASLYFLGGFAAGRGGTRTPAQWRQDLFGDETAENRAASTMINMKGCSNTNRQALRPQAAGQLASPH